MKDLDWYKNFISYENHKIFHMLYSLQKNKEAVFF